MSAILPAYFAELALPQRRDLSNNSTAPVVPPKEFHGPLGDWAVVCHGLNICSVVCCIIVLLSSTVFVIKNRNLLSRPSLRLSTSIAVCDLIYSVSQLFVFNNEYMSGRNELTVRAMLWIMAGASVTFVLLSTCMGIQLLLTVLTRKSRYAYRIQPYYEVASFFIGFFVTHPYMYLFTKVAWLPTAQSFHIRAPMHVFFRNLWLMQLSAVSGQQTA
ncbi:hypothetical protein EC988_002114 [Linderina pennispora]|nr:hypothetical protein EC988_002114 [Linderina pennispora]